MVNVMWAKLRSAVRLYADIITVSITAVVFLAVLFKLTNPQEIYIKLSLDKTFLTVFGILLGFLITAYSILVSLVPSTPKGLLESHAYSRINTIFVICILINISFVVLSIIAFFVTQITGFELIGTLQVIVSIFLLSFTFLIIIYLREIFLMLRDHYTHK